jgi:hypothetical protein
MHSPENISKLMELRGEIVKSLDPLPYLKDCNIGTACLNILNTLVRKCFILNWENILWFD